jgi:exopolysaccharide biosynthesis polyprenyl glycosylphosphotransferase
VAETLRTDSHASAPTPSQAGRAALGPAAERVLLLAIDTVALLSSGFCVLGVGGSGTRTTVACLAGSLSALAGRGLYRYHLRLSALDDTPRLAAAAVTGSATALGLLWAIDVPQSRGASLGSALLTATAAVICGRTAGYALVRAVRVRRAGRAALIVGTGRVAAYLARVLANDRAYGLAPVGQLTSSRKIGDTPLPILGDSGQLPYLIDDLRPSHVLVAFTERREADLVEVLRGVRGVDVDVLCVPRLFEIHPGTRAAERIGSVPLVRLCRADRDPLARAAKRLIDVTVACVALVVLAPLFAACALAVRIESGPGVLFRQERLGRDGVPFTLLKFRSLRPADAEEAATLWSVSGDARIGRVGRLLRRTSLDELPQLINVLRGDMSLVGPRPERPHFVAEFSRQHSHYRHRHRADVGLTGWAQVNGLRGPTSIADRALLDNWYIENWSLWLDLKIVLLTVGAVLRDMRGGRR